MQRKRRRKSFRSPLHTACWSLAAAFCLVGCSGTSGTQSSATNPTSPATPIVNLGAERTSVEMPVAAEEPPEVPIAKVRPTGPLVGQHAPDIVAELVSGSGPASIAEARGKVVLIDFWATFCAPCQTSFPKYQGLVDQFHGDFAVIAISVDDPDTDKATLQGFVQHTRVTFPVLWDKDAEMARVYQIPKMPTSFIVDKSGIIRHVHAGYTAQTPDAMAQQIKALLAQ